MGWMLWDPLLTRCDERFRLVTSAQTSPTSSSLFLSSSSSSSLPGNPISPFLNSHSILLSLSFGRPQLQKRTHTALLVEMPSLPFAWLGRSPFQLSRFFRGLEQDVETVIKVLQPGPLGIVEHKFSAAEIHEAKATVERAIANWRKNAAFEKHGHFVKGGEK